LTAALERVGVVVGIVTGGLVWLAIAGALLVWAAATYLLARGRSEHPVPTLGDVVGFFLESALGRLLLIAAWAEVGWHLLCQRP
jgi:hypothetical protein